MATQARNRGIVISEKLLPSARNLFYLCTYGQVFREKERAEKPFYVKQTQFSGD